MEAAVVIKKSDLKGVVQVPSSKSHTVRAILLASIAHGKSALQNVLLSNDARALIQCCNQYGAKIELNNDGLQIEGNRGVFQATQKIFNVNNSGLALRFLTAFLAHGIDPFIINGDFSIQKRPIQPLLQALVQQQAIAKTIFNSFAPIYIQGPVEPMDVQIDGSDSQYVSSLIFSSLLFSKPVTLHIQNPKEIPFIQMSLSWLDFLNIEYENDQYQKITLFPKGRVEAFNRSIPLDFSSASYPIVAALLTQSHIQIKGLDFSDSQGDKALIEVLRKMGANIQENKGVLDVFGSSLQGIEIDCDPFIDAICILAIVGCFAKGKTVLKNAKSARFKECDRIACLAKELKKCGVRLEEKEDGLVIYESQLKPQASVDTYLDHRLALSFIVLGLNMESLEINGIECIEKTYPKFLSELQKCGACIEEFSYSRI